MEQAVEWYVAITSLIIGASHIIRADDWVEVYNRLRCSGRPGAFANGGFHLATGAAIVAGHRVWTWPAVVVTILGLLLLLKGSICFLLPNKALRSMERGATRTGFIAAGVVAIAIGVWALVLTCLY